MLLLISTSPLHSYCFKKDNSYKRYVEKSDTYKKEKLYDQAVEAINKHLVCYPDKEVYVKLAELYHVQKKYYLEGLIYKKIGMMEKYREAEKNRLSILNPELLKDFSTKMKNELNFMRNDSKNTKQGSIFLYSIGGAMTLAGLGLFIYNKGFNGEIGEIYQYHLLIGGLSVISAGFILGGKADYKSNSAISLGNLNSKDVADPATKVDEYFIHTGAENNAKKLSARSLRNNGIFVTLTSATILTFSMFSIFDSYKNSFKNTESSDFEMLFIIPVKILLSIPGTLLMGKGISMIVRASRWSRLKDEEQFITLNSISPTFNPITKTYGISMGFSF
jgi:tetratricopeptide (TPR) repeat protein